MQNEPGVYIIAEIGLNHNGSIDIAHDLIDVAAEACVNAVKFQKRTVENLAIKTVLDAVDNRFPKFGKTYREIREHLEFNIEQFTELKVHANRLDVDFFVTPFDLTALNFLEDLNLDTYKIASHSVTNLDFVRKVAETGKQVIMSTGMSFIEEIDTAVNLIRDVNPNLSLLHCVSSYPTPITDCNLLVIPELKARYGLPVGYSGHEVGFKPTLAAVAMGASLVERHITLDTNMVGFDHKLSLCPEELRNLVLNIREIEIMHGNSSKTLLPVEQITRDKYNVSMVSAREIFAGDVLTEESITWKNPGTGIPRKEAKSFLGRKLVVNVSKDILITQEMFG